MMLAIDPGKEKCGLAVLQSDGKLIQKAIVKRPALGTSIKAWLSRFPISKIIIGESASGKEIYQQIKKQNLFSNLFFVSEKYSSEEARRLYWQENAPKGFWRLVPRSLLFPPPIDDYAAAILGQRFLKINGKG